MTIISSALSVACALCGAHCETDARFCPHCGSPISRSEKGDDALTGKVLDNVYRLAERMSVDALFRCFRSEFCGSSDVSVCVVHDHLARNRGFQRAFCDAAQDAVKLAHPGILRIWKCGQTEVDGKQRLFVVSEAFEGRNLCAIVQAHGLLPVSQVLLIALEVLEALDGAHRQGIVHGDLLPENILIGATDDGEVRAKVGNFVFGRLASLAAPRLLSGGTFSGTSHYSAPELIRGGEPNARTDLYSFGAILYEMLTGKRPFDGSSCAIVERMHLQRAPKQMAALAPDRGVGPHVQTVVMRALNKDPARRFASASAMLRALREAKEADSDGPVSVTPVRPTKLMQRADVLDALHTTALAPVAYGKEDYGQPRGAVALVFGGAGMGKSSVIRHVESKLEGGPIAVLRVDGKLSLTRPLEPFTSLARKALGLRHGAPEVIVQTVQKTLGEKFHVDAEDTTRLLDRVTGRPSSLNLTPDVAEREQVWALRSFIGRVLAMRPTLLIIEDADAMDACSLRLTRDLMEASATLALSVIVSSRNDPWPEWTSEYVTRLQVGSLGNKTARQLLNHRLTGHDVQEAAKTAAVDWAKGSPLLIDLCARALQRREMLEDRNGKFKVPSSSQDLFGGLQQLVVIFLRGVSPCARRWISCSAVAGAMASIEMLDAFESPRPNRDAVIAMCEETGLVRCVDDSLVFDNEGVRDVVQAMIPPMEKRQIHVFMATWLREFEPPRAPLEVIATHLLAGGEMASAAELFEADAHDLARRDEPHAAASLFGRAERIWRDTGDLAAMQRAGLARAETLLVAGDAKAASGVISEMERFAPVSADGLRARVFASVAAAQGNRDLALEALQRASDVAVDRLDRDQWFEVEFQFAEALFKLGRLEEAEVHASISLEISTAGAENENDTATLIEGARIAQAATFLSKIRMELGRSSQARDALTHSLRHTAVLGDQASASRLFANLAYACAAMQETEASLDYARRAYELARSAGDRMAASRISINLGVYWEKLDQTFEALEAFSRAKALARAVGWARGVRLSESAAARIRAHQD